MTTSTRILQVSLVSFYPTGNTKFKYEKKSKLNCGSCSQMTPSWKLPIYSCTGLLTQLLTKVYYHVAHETLWMVQFPVSQSPSELLSSSLNSSSEHEYSHLRRRSCKSVGTFKDVSVPDTFTMAPCPILHLSFFFSSDCIGCSGFRDVHSC